MNIKFSEHVWDISVDPSESYDVIECLLEELIELYQSQFEAINKDLHIASRNEEELEELQKEVERVADDMCELDFSVEKKRDRILRGIKENFYDDAETLESVINGDIIYRIKDEESFNSKIILACASYMEQE